MRSAQIICNLVLYLFTVYYLQGTIYPSNSIISQSSLLLALLISAVYFVKSLFGQYKKSLFFIAWSSLLLLNMIGYLLTGDFSNFFHNLMFKETIGCMLPFYPFYYFAEKGEIKATVLRRYLLIMLPVIILQFLLNRNQLISLASSGDEDIVNNVAYSFVALLPLVFLFKNKVISSVLTGIIIIFIIQGAKRGAIIAGAIGLIGFYYYQIRSLEKHNRIVGYLIAIVAIFILSAFAYRVFQSNEFLISRMILMSEGDTSNRDVLFKDIFNSWYNSENVWNFILGYGYAASLMLTGGHYAHNDWLELLSNFGLIGIGSYLFLFYSAIKLGLNKGWMQSKRILILTVIMIWLFTTLISSWYMALCFYIEAILLGTLAGSKSINLE